MLQVKLFLTCSYCIYINFRLSVAEECFIGFSSRDHSTQTDKNEILDMKELVDIIDTLAVVSSNQIFEIIHLKIILRDLQCLWKSQQQRVFQRPVHPSFGRVIIILDV